MSAASGGVDPTTERGEKDILEEVLDLVRTVQRDVTKVRYEARDRGRYADPAEVFDIVELARMMIDQPSLQDQIATGDISLIRQSLHRAHERSLKDRHGERILTAREYARMREAEGVAARMSAAEDASDDIFDPEHGDTAMFPGKTIG